MSRSTDNTTSTQDTDTRSAADNESTRVASGVSDDLDLELEEEDVLADATGPVGKKAAAISTLSELFPNRTKSEIGRVVALHPDNLDAAAAQLASPPENVTADEQLARSLQAAESATARTTPSTHVNLDERLARSLQAAETRPTRPAPFRPTAAILSEAVTMVRDVIVPSVHSRLKSLTFSNLTQQTSPTMRYSLRDVGVVALSLPTDNVTVRAGGGVIRVYLVNMYVSLAVGAFSYESTGLLPWSDTGALDASVASLTAIATLRPGRTTSGAVALSVRDINVTVDGAVRVRARGTSADWAYNTLAAVCKPLIVSYIKDTVERQLRASLQSELREFMYFPEQQQDGNNQTPPITEPATGSAT